MAATRRFSGGDVAPTVWRALVWSYRKGERKLVLLRKSNSLSLLMSMRCPSAKDLLRKEVARGRDRGALARRSGGGSGRPGATVLWRRREECIFPGGARSVVKSGRKSEWK